MNLLKPEDVAQMLGVKLQTIRYWAYSRRIPYIKVGNRLRFDPSHLDRWLAENTFPALGNPVKRLSPLPRRGAQKPRRPTPQM